MCVVSMIFEHYEDKWDRYSWYPKNPSPPFIPITIPKDDIEDIKKDLEELKRLIKRGRKYDIANNQPDCESDEKSRIIRHIASACGMEVTVFD